MKFASLGLLAGLGMLALTLPAGAAPATGLSGGSDVRTEKAPALQFAQRSEERGGNIKGKKAKKKAAKKSKKKKG